MKFCYLVSQNTEYLDDGGGKPEVTFTDVDASSDSGSYLGKDTCMIASIEAEKFHYSKLSLFNTAKNFADCKTGPNQAMPGSDFICKKNIVEGFGQFSLIESLSVEYKMRTVLRDKSLEETLLKDTLYSVIIFEPNYLC